MKVLVACEESQEVCKAFRERGHSAFSCDILDCSGGHPEWHVKDDVTQILSPKDHGNNYLPAIWFTTMDGQFHEVAKWDIIIAHPPCTYLTITGNRWFNRERYGDKAVQREKDREDAANFFMKFVEADCDKIAIENPVGYMGTRYRKADQVVHPYFFGDPHRKATCLWLKGLPLLLPTNMVEPKLYVYANGKKDGLWHVETMKLPREERSRARSKTFHGLAVAMAEQWGDRKEVDE